MACFFFFDGHKRRRLGVQSSATGLGNQYTQKGGEWRAYCSCRTLFVHGQAYLQQRIERRWRVCGQARSAGERLIKHEVAYFLAVEFLVRLGTE